MNRQRFPDFQWWFKKFCDQPSRVARVVVLNRREHPREVVKAAVAALREWKSA